ncbi:MAG: hypothetical protein KY476_25695, partial [Planctomycetes bacterium]|nr:hypothetical protein [Planctomycetota bacterium]
MSLHSRFNTRRLFIATIASLVLVPAVEVLAQPEDIEVEVDVAVEEQAAPASPVAPPSTGTSSGTEAPSPAEKPVNPNSVAGILQQVDAREAELVRLGLEKQPAAPAAERKELHVLLDPAFLGVYYDGSPNRFFVARLRLVNRTAKPVEIKGRDIALLADGKTLRLEDIPAQLRGYNFLVGNKGYSLSSAEFNTPEKVAVPAGGTSDVWVVYAKLDKGTKVPAMKLRVPVAEGDVREIDVNEQAMDVLKRRIELIGPRQAMAIVLIGGEINTINVQDLVNGFEELAAEKVS